MKQMHNRRQEIKLAQKSSYLYKVISEALIVVCQDDARLSGIYPTRVKLSEEGGLATVFFYTQAGEADFKEKLPILILYKPSMRHTVAKALESRYTPELVFAYDATYEKEFKVQRIIDSLKKETDEAE